MDNLELIQLAEMTSEKSYSPYSNFKVGAALLCDDGEVFLGCNVENVSFGATNCAERTALFSAIANGQRHFSKIAVIGSTEGVFTSAKPCGICRQVLSEFCDGDFTVITIDKDKVITYKLRELLPNAFTEF